MLRPSLRSIPDVNWNAGWQLRPYETGFERHWFQIHLAAEKHLVITPETFSRVFGADTDILRERQVYLFSAAGVAVGTVTAWFGPDFPEEACGRVHYLAVLPDFQRQGLGKALLSESLRLMRRLGCTKAYLATADTRLPAIRLYLQSGFEPVCRTPEEGQLWKGILAQCTSGGAVG